MALRLREVVTVGLWAILLAGCAYAFCGCTFVMKDDGTLEAGIATTVTLKQVGPKDIHQQSAIGVEFEQWFQEFLVRTIPEYLGIDSDSDGDGVADMSGEPEDEAVDDPADTGGG